MSHPASVRLSAPHFYLPLIHILAKLGGYEPGKPVHMDDVVAAVVELTGVNPDDYGMQESSGMPWVRRWILWAFRNNQNKATYEAKFNKGAPGTTTGCGRRQWALTEAGVTLANEIRCDYDEEYNWTSAWLTEALATTNLMDRLRIHLGCHFGLSAKSQRIDDHVQNWLLSAIENDLLGEHLRAGRKVSHRVLCGFSGDTTKSELRKDGQDAHMRSMYGALTARDREEYNPRDVSKFHLPIDTQVTCLGENAEGGTALFTGGAVIGSVMDVMDDGSVNVENDILHNMIVEQCMNRLSDELDARKPGAGGRYGEILDAVRLGISTEELAEEQGVSLNRASTLKAVMMRTLRDAVDDGALGEVQDNFFGEGL
jgi:hypothetical protein